MNMRRIALLVLVLCACFALTISAAGGNFGEFDVFDTTEQTTEAPAEQTTESPETTEPNQTETTPAETETTAPEGTTDPGSTTEPEGSVSGEETSDPAGTETEGGEVTTERPGAQTTEPNEAPSESETQSEQGSDTPLPLPLILAVLGVLFVGCIAVVAFVLIKYARAQKA